ncbi:ARID multi-domain protein [Pyrenophora tritici-repentis]|nr:ARID multi-domain protein [Pyrenophora tritici-repentis]KAF7451549.1 ARID multi-domain protein [Pyrenophora tritici-repentis]KAI1541899.1 ARID multi-domain protein [Pyrenophora tritici-repentis]KAI1554622.1 ARID multi-domain protein [Pyrenophora tritici-repentis]PZD33459.1 ARID multi-domain protein [Pyrenophora tritici-repentis]
MDFQSPQNAMYDPSSFIDPSAIANSQMNGSRPYNPMPSVPQKRDSTGAALSLSRSQTPSQPAQFGFQHQQAFTNTPSPTMQNQHFAPGQMGGQRMQTASPAQNPHAPQMSPMGFQQSPMNQGFNANAANQFPVTSNVAALMAQQNRPFHAQPQCAGRIINLQNLYSAVIRFKGCRAVTQQNGWPRIAQMMQIHPGQYPNAPNELRQIYENNLLIYETAYVQRQQQQMQQKGMPLQQQMGQMGPMGSMGQQMSPTRPTMPGQQNNVPSLPPTQPPHQQLEPSPHPQQATPLQGNAVLPSVNGTTPQPDGHARKSLSRQLEGTPTQGQEPNQAQTTPMKQEENAAATDPNSVAVEEAEKRKPVIEQDDGTRVYQPAYRTQDTWGGLDFDSDNFKNMIDTITNYKPNCPMLPEMGVIDVRAITMSIKSGLHAEARLGLDTLTRITYDNTVQFNLSHCEDLTEVLVEYAEDLLEILGNDNPEVTDIIDLMPYEDVLHHCREEAASLQELPQAGTKEHRLDRTADRLIAITTIFRNLSFLEVNHDSLVSPPVLKFLANFIRLVGTRVLLLRSHINTFDFMKDVVTFFSNTSAKVVLPSREDAYAVLHFLCAFAPVPRPGEPIKFTPFNPQIHRYLPSAVDSLAKLLARDDPNRMYYKEIFINEATSTPAYDLLTRSFALAISVIPDRNYIENKMYQMKEPRPKEVRMFEARVAESRKAYLMQGMLAADILAGLAPGPETGICRAWLESEDGWAHSLLKFAMSLSATDAAIPHPPPPPNHRGQRPMDHDREGFQLIVHRALSTLKRLGDKSKGGEPLIFNFNGSSWRVKADILPRKETLLGALLTAQLDVRSLNQFCKIGYLDE